MTTPPSKDQLLDGLETKSFGRNIYTFAEIDSTNICARTLAETGASEGTVVWADHQTAGRGRLGRSWSDEPGANLLLSVILRGFPDQQFNRTSYYISEAVAGGIERGTGVSVAAKWPNDLLLNGKKICGMLLEGSDAPNNRYVIAGIGLNVNQSSFPEDIRPRATSLSLEIGSPVDRKELFQAIMDNMEALLSELRDNGDAAILDAWKDRCETFGKAVSIQSGHERIDGKALDLSPDGGLLLETKNGFRTIHAGDVTIISSRKKRE